MTILGMTRRRALAALAAAAVAPLAGTSAEAAVRIRRVSVDVAPIRAQRGATIAGWLADDLPGAIRRSLGGRYAPGAAQGATLFVRIDSLTMPPFRVAGGARVIDEIIGHATLSGPGVATRSQRVRVTVPIRAEARHIPRPVETQRRRVSDLTVRFAHWLPRELGI